ncbi:MAG: hypothetical protein ACK5MR_19035 [Cumulibacter sp.]
MVRQIIPFRKTAEDGVYVTYTWGYPGDERTARLDKSTGAAEPLKGTTDAEAAYAADWISRVRQLNEMAGFPDEAPIYR